MEPYFPPITPPDNKPVIPTLDLTRYRITAALAFLMALAFWYTFSPYIIIFLVADYAMRGFGTPYYSTLNWLASKVQGGPGKAVKAAPKVLKARIGFVLGLAVFTLASYGQAKLTEILAGVMLVYTVFVIAFSFRKME
ncbi:MAG: DUF4395 family protein [Bacteroidota bacterium]